jgi:hypothetical protein
LSHTTKPGNLETLPEDELGQEVAVEEGRGVPWKIIVLGVIALVLAVVIGTQVIGVLFVILFPPAPPLPANVTLVSHSNADYGVDEWLYTSNQNVCDVLIFYMERGGQCRIAPLQCGDNRTDDETLTGVDSSGQHIARCVGETTTSIFAMRWQAVIATGSTPETRAQFRLQREIFWSGQVPPMPEQPELEVQGIE